MKLVAYLRVSTDEQERSGLGLEAQESKVRAYCDLYGHELVALVQDSASGKNLNRPGLQEALSMLKSGEADGLIVAKLDRLTRSVVDMGQLLKSYFSGRSSLVVVVEQVDTGTAAGRLVVNLLTSVSEWERQAIGERTRDALRAKRARGEKTGGGVPFGFSVVDGKLVEDRQEQEVMRLVLDLRAEGYSFRQIAAQLNRDGATPKRGGQWFPAQVRNLCVRPTYAA